MSILLREVKLESSSSRQQEVIELMFTCEMVISLSSMSELWGEVWCVGEDAEDPSVAARRPESEDETMLVR